MKNNQKLRKRENELYWAHPANSDLRQSWRRSLFDQNI